MATIVEKRASDLKIHYDGWSRKWDCYCDYNKELHRFAQPKSVSGRHSHRFKHLKKGDFVDINPTQRHPGWIVGEIRRKDVKSGQVQVVYESQNKNYLYWAHLDNKNEIAEFTTRSGTDQKLQKQVESSIKQKENGREEVELPDRQGKGRNGKSSKSQKTKPQRTYEPTGMIC